MAVDIETPSLVIEMADPNILKPHPEAELIPMSEEDEKALKAGIKRDGHVHTPLQITSENVILDGIHRWKYAIELGIPKVPVVILHFETPEQEHLRAIHANLERRQISEGQRAFLELRILDIERTITEKYKKAANKEATIQQWEKKRIEEQKPVIKGWVPALVREPIPEKPDLQKYTRKNRENESAEKIAKASGVSARSLYQAQAVKRQAPELEKAVLQGSISLKKAYTQVQTEKKSQELKEAMESGKTLTDLEIMQKLNIPVQPYDVWNFPTCDDRFGSDYPGRIPGQLVAHCLYFWTEQGDLVLDPMGGSGTTIDVCKALNRRALAYDAHPSREDITLHNLATQGWPEATKDAKLIFWDPPYFKKKDDGYGEQSISRFDRSEYLAFFDQMATTIPDEFQGRMAFLMSDYNDEENLQECIWFTDYVNIFTRRNWQIERFIYPPLTTQSVHPDIMQKFRASKRLARLGRVLVVMSR